MRPAVRVRVDALTMGPRFGRLWASTAATNLADGVLLAGLPVLATTLTTDARLVAGVHVAMMGAMALGALPGGVVADRSDRRRALVGANLVRALGLCAVVLVGLAGGWAVAAIYLAAALMGATETLADVTAEVAVPELVGPAGVGRAHSRLIGSQVVMNEGIGAPIGGLVAVAGLGWALLVPAALYATGAAVVRRLPMPRVGAPAGRATLRSTTSEIAAGVRALRRDPLLIRMGLASTLLNVANTAFFAVAVLLVIGPAGLPREAYGLLLVAVAVGGVTGTAVAARALDRFGIAGVLRVGPAAMCVAYAAMCAVPTTWVFVVALFGVAMAGMVWNVSSRVVRQQRVDPGLLGRVGASLRMVSLCAAPAGGVVGGLVAEAFGVRAVGWVTGAATAVALALVWRAGRLAGPGDGQAPTTPSTVA